MEVEAQKLLDMLREANNAQDWSKVHMVMQRLQDRVDGNINCASCGGSLAEPRKNKLTIDIRDLDGDTISIPCEQTWYRCKDCGFEFSDVIGEYERTEAMLQWFMNKAVELKKKLKEQGNGQRS